MFIPGDLRAGKIIKKKNQIAIIVVIRMMFHYELIQQGYCVSTIKHVNAPVTRGPKSRLRRTDENLAVRLCRSWARTGKGVDSFGVNDVKTGGSP